MSSPHNFLFLATWEGSNQALVERIPIPFPPATDVNSLYDTYQGLDGFEKNFITGISSTMLVMGFKMTVINFLRPSSFISIFWTNPYSFNSFKISHLKEEYWIAGIVVFLALYAFLILIKRSWMGALTYVMKTQHK